MQNMADFISQHGSVVPVDPAALHAFLTLVPSSYKKEKEYTTVTVDNVVTAWQVSYDCWVPAFSPFTCMLPLGVSSDYLVKNIGDIHDQLTKKRDAVIATEALGLLSNDQGPVTDDKHFLWLDSPLSTTMPDMESLLASIPKRKRDNLKADLKLWPDATVYLDTNPTNCVGWLKERWKDNEDYTDFSLAQHAWACSSSDTLFFSMENVATAYFYKTSCPYSGRSRYVFQGIASTPSARRIGSVMLALCNLALHKMGISEFDPTCQPMIDENACDVYKRVVGNTPNKVPLLYAQKGSGGFPPCYSNNEWVFE